MTSRHQLAFPSLACIALVALAQGTAPAPTSEQEVLARFAQRERERSQALWLRGYALPPAPAPFDLQSLERQLWYSDWWLRQQMGAPPAGGAPYCQAPYYIAGPPFRQCVGQTRR